MAHLDAKYSFKNDINTCYISPFFSLAPCLIILLFASRSSVLDAPDPSPLYSFTWQQSWCFLRDSMSCCPVPTHNHKTGTMHCYITPSDFARCLLTTLQFTSNQRAAPPLFFLLVSLLAFPGTNLSGSGECCSGFSLNIYVSRTLYCFLNWLDLCHTQTAWEERVNTRIEGMRWIKVLFKGAIFYPFSNLYPSSRAPSRQPCTINYLKTRWIFNAQF